jgi:4'-phosphopantetheinyl transferase
MRCDVWWARPAVASPRLLALLDETERERYGNYRREVDQLRFLTGRTLIRAVAGQWLGTGPEDVALDASCYDCGKPHGKPRVLADGAPQVSISHSGQWVALAVVEDVPVGIDVEEIRSAEVADLARISFSATERTAFARLPEQEQRTAFFTYWARKEAVVKAIGRGMSVAMSRFTLSAHDQPPAVLASEAAEVDPAAVRMADLAAGDGYRASVAVIAGEPPQVVERQADDLIRSLG